MRIGVICEGVTDFPVIRNILYAFFREDQIDLLQRLPDIPVNYSHAQPNNILGGWREIPKFLSNAEFRQSVSMFDYLIVQIDTDICEQTGFDVIPQSMAEQDRAGFYERIKVKLAEWIDQGEPNFFAQHQHQLIFCISIHSLEYWLLIQQYPECVGQKHNSFKTLNGLIAMDNILGLKKNALAKKPRTYERLSQPFSNLAILAPLAQQSFSLGRFCQQIQQIPNSRLMSNLATSP